VLVGRRVWPNNHTPRHASPLSHSRHRCPPGGRRARGGEGLLGTRVKVRPGDILSIVRPLFDNLSTHVPPIDTLSPAQIDTVSGARALPPFVYSRITPLFVIRHKPQDYIHTLFTSALAKRRPTLPSSRVRAPAPCEKNVSAECKRAAGVV